MFNTVWTSLADGGVVLIVLVLLSVFATAVIVLKLLQWPSQRIGSDAAVDAWFTQPANVPEAPSTPRPARIRLLNELSALSGRFAPEELLREGERRARRLLAAQQSFLRPLEIIAMVAPLLGLLGTVLGMIEAFKAMEAAGSQVDPAVLSGGIWQALSTTAAGLMVAIPASLAHSAFERRVETSADRFRDDLDRFFHAGASTRA